VPSGKSLAKTGPYWRRYIAWSSKTPRERREACLVDPRQRTPNLKPALFSHLVCVAARVLWLTGGSPASRHAPHSRLSHHNGPRDRLVSLVCSMASVSLVANNIRCCRRRGRRSRRRATTRLGRPTSCTWRHEDARRGGM